VFFHRAIKSGLSAPKLVTNSRAAREQHRKLATECFNQAWELLDDPHRDEAGDRRLLDLVHASSYHWALVGGPKEQAVAEWQISRAYASVNEPTLALGFASACLATCQAEELSDVLSTAYEGIARAHGLAGRPRLAREYLQKARAALDAAPLDAEDRKVYLGQIRDTESKIGRE
jgi:hypothetical protein